MIRLRAPRRTELVLALAVLASCGEDPGRERPGGCKLTSCDLPSDPAARSCELRRADAYNENQLGFTETALRWSCADVNGVTGVDRGQEYCEYFAVVMLPGSEAGPQVIGRLVRIEDEKKPDELRYDVLSPTLELSETAIDDLERDEAALVGQCVFTSWNSDYADPLPVCSESSCVSVMGLPVDAENFQMKFEVNSAGAGRQLVEDCMCAFDPTYDDCVVPDPLEGDLDNDRDILHDDFMRGCMLNAEINQTEFRKSDSTICSSMLRMAECGCGVDSGSLIDLAMAVSPSNRRGFPLGTWSALAELPPGCQFVDLGDGSQTVVACDLSAAEVLNHSADLKQLCREKYGPNVVVHVPITPLAITCEPSESVSAYAETCSTTPWVLTDVTGN